MRPIELVEDDGTTLAERQRADDEEGRPENGVTCTECGGRGGDVPEDGPCETCNGYGEVEMEDKINELAADLEERDQECRALEAECGRLELELLDSVQLTAEQKTTVLCALIGDLRKAQGNYDDFGSPYWVEEERRLREAIVAVAGGEYLEALEGEL